MYSDKVIEHFNNPRNMGEIPDADGIGKVGNPVCLLPEEYIQVNDNIKTISDIKVGENVLSHDGEYHRVKRKITRQYQGEMLEIKNRLGRFSITPEHECYSIKLPKTHHYLYLRNKKKKKPFWYHVGELEKGDILCYPVLKEITDIDEIKLDVKKLKYDFKSRKLPDKVKINADFLLLAGYYLSEGSVRDEICKTYLSFTFHSDEVEYASDVKKIVKKLFGVDARITVRDKRKTMVVDVYNAHLARFFKRLFRNKAKNKRLPHFMILLPAKKQKNIIKGLWRGDGFINLKIPRAGFSTISHELCNQLKTLLLRQGIIPSVYIEDEKVDKDGVKHQRVYRIHVGQRDSLERLFKLLGVEHNFTRDARMDSWIDNDYIYIPITDIKSMPYSGSVHNLEVDDSMSYVTESATLHNCGDVMYIYIKVKDDRIADIKFKTMGCAAAIATSSIITELAKGKTLDEAMKITKKSVSDALEGLPPIKQHCSNLAADGLHKAIEDYRGKK